MSNGNRHRRKKQKTSRKRRIPVPKKAPKVETPKTTYRREKFHIDEIEDLRAQSEEK